MLQKHLFCLIFSLLAFPNAPLRAPAKKYGNSLSEGDFPENNVAEDNWSRRF